jgi:RNA polymerase sigma factor (sigma-70 family)
VAEKTLAELISALPEEFQIVLKMHYLRGLSAEEIAEKLQIPVATVVRVITNGRALLARELGLK